MSELKFFNREFPDSYEELITYYPRYYYDVLEMCAILHAHGKFADALLDDIEQVFLNNFIEAADLSTIEMWEDMLGITHNDRLTLEQRRTIVLAYLIRRDHIGEPEIRDIIRQYSQAEVTVDFALGIIYITIAEELFEEEELIRNLYQRIPAHLALHMQFDTDREYDTEQEFRAGVVIQSHIKATLVG